MGRKRELYCVIWAGVERNGRGFRNTQACKNELEALSFIAQLQSQDNIYCIELEKRIIWDKR